MIGGRVIISISEIGYLRALGFRTNVEAYLTRIADALSTLLLPFIRNCKDFFKAWYLLANVSDSP